MADHRHYKKKTDAALLAIEERVKWVAATVVEYKASDDLKFEIAEGAIFSYHISFKEYLGKVKEFFFDVDVTHIMS